MSNKKPESGITSTFSQAQSRQEMADRIDTADINFQAPEQTTKKTATSQWDEKAIAVARQAIDEQMGLRR